MNRRWTKMVVRGGTVLAILVGAVIAWQILTWPDVGELADTNPSTTAFIERHRRQHPGQDDPGDRLRSWIPYAEISPNLKKAVLVAEDINFFSHDGFDSGEIREAVREAVKEGRAPRGASTISQQLARNLWLSPSTHAAESAIHSGSSSDCIRPSRSMLT